MKISLKSDSVAYIAVKAAIFITCLLPWRVAFFIGKAIGLSMYHLHPRRKRIAYANLKAAFSKEKTPSELKRILRRTYQNYGQNIIEMLRMPRIDGEYLKKYVTIDRQDIIDAAHKRRKGAIYLTSHFGNWELSSLKSGEAGYPVHALVRPQKNEKLNALLNSFRARQGCKVINRGMSTREIIRALRTNKTIGILGDQDVGKSGVFVDLLGRPASHAVGAVRIARDTGAAVIPAFIVREGGPIHTIKIGAYDIIEKTDDRDADIKRGLERQSKILEDQVRRYPDQWMWVYTRWKSTPLRKIAILTDGKQGHINQSLAALEVIKNCRHDAGFRGVDTAHEMIEVKFKNRIMRMLLSICAAFATGSCQGSIGFLKHFLEEESYKRIIHTYADIVISSGSSLSAVNIFLTKENNAKNVVLMKPGMVPLKMFNVAVIPGHDRPRPKDNVVVTEGSPNLVDETAMTSAGRRIKERLPRSKKRNVGLLLGGDTPAYSLTEELMDKMMDRLDKALTELDMDLLVTTSRRTPKNVEGLLKERLKGNPRCRLLIIANEKNIDNAVSGILNLSDVVIVSGESMSMVSEAASSGRQTLVFDLKKKRPSFKHGYAIDRLASMGYIKRAPVERIDEAVSELSRLKTGTKRLDNQRMMYEKLYRVI